MVVKAIDTASLDAMRPIIPYYPRLSEMANENHVSVSKNKKNRDGETPEICLKYARHIFSEGHFGNIMMEVNP